MALWSNQDSGQNPPFEPSRLIDTTLQSQSAYVQPLTNAISDQRMVGLQPVYSVKADSLDRETLAALFTLLLDALAAGDTSANHFVWQRLARAARS